MWQARIGALGQGKETWDICAPCWGEGVQDKPCKAQHGFIGHLDYTLLLFLTF